MSFLNNLVRTTEKVINDSARAVGGAIDQSWASPLLDQLQTGMFVQICSRQSDKTLQIVQAPDGRLVVDGLGPIGPNYPHTLWEVNNFGKNDITLSSQGNFLAIVAGQTVILHYDDISYASADCHFRAVDQASHLCLQSVTSPTNHVGVLKNGSLKPAFSTNKGLDGQWRISLTVRPGHMNVPAPPPKKTMPIPARH